MCSKSNQQILGYEAVLLMADFVPVFHPAYNVPMRARGKVEVELEGLVHEGILTPTKYAHWVSPIVVVSKPNGEIRICFDCSVTINRYLITHHTPLPNVEEIFALI